MEKISALIDKLQELKTTGATLQSISYYVQLLQAEILHARSLERERERELQRRQSNIAVIMPGATMADPEVTVDSNDNITAPQFTPSESIPVVEYKRPEPPAPEPVGMIEPAPVVNQPIAEKTPEPAPEPLRAYQSPAPTLEALKAYQSPVPEQDALKAYQTPAPEPKPVPVPEPPVAYQPPTPAPEPIPAPAPTPAPKEEEKQPVFITLFGDHSQPVVSASRPEKVEKVEKPEKTEKPETNGIHSELKELNQKVAQNIPSLNDRLRQSQSEIGDRFNDMPIKDLRQAIGINDKFQFIQELFRGDVDSYERSVKTINEMHSLPDAEYWIERELKIRQGWVDDNRVVRQFYALVKKRFS
ncbi:hypothetical protein [[Flexibacter] sp. ATCC 35208]|uniref:hypothetical protein n=1 Tax=[Flexibacter] sp. ATCC 35208 TaxID=1936242 RepID=UPI0009C9F7E9|nr:hypothetical protein [[Flexibacter] sp. ATCC 35208]OMP80665.1 hypothetical protein BW716_03965 [[Flexibacter] sp. ATCC 35208]